MYLTLKLLTTYQGKNVLGVHITRTQNCAGVTGTVPNRNEEHI